MIIDGSHASSSEDEFEKELDLLEQQESPDQAINSTLYANAQIKQKVTSSIEKMERLGRLKADSVWKIIDTLDEPLRNIGKNFECNASCSDVSRTIVLFYEVYFKRSPSEYEARSIGRYFVFTSKRAIRQRNNSSHEKHEIVKDIFKFF